ncbi:MAG: M4 family metallopeptidase [Steroidobacteraceae bacterium]
MNIWTQTWFAMVRRVVVWGGSALLLLLPGTSITVGQEAPAVRLITAASKVRYVAPSAARANRLRTLAVKPSVADASRTALDTYATFFGITSPDQQLEQTRSTSLGANGDVVRMHQVVNGVPVIAGDMVMSLDGSGQMQSLSGRVNPRLSIATTPRIGATEARRTAALLTAKQHAVPVTALDTSTPELSIYDASLFGQTDGAPPVLVWRVEVTPLSVLLPIREFVLIDAITGGRVLNFSQLETLRSRLTYSAGNTSTLPGALLCNELQPLCTSGVNADADLAHRYAGQTYDFYQTHHGRDSFNNLGATIISSVQWYAVGGCPNAAWTGTQMIYCAGAAQADDVVGHELTHAVTQNTSGLFYYYQSGAINESLSDVWGEFLDLTNGEGTDTPAVRWQAGEDFAGLGPIRNMRDPTLFGDPDKMTSSYYWTASTDNGGVHTNSGVNNHAAALMVDGGTFNGYTISGIGIDKVADIYYRVQTQHLTSGSDYADLYVALNQACQNLIGGSRGITGADCQQVTNATNAVEMNVPPVMDAGSDAPLCAANEFAVNGYYDSFETVDPTRWASSSLIGATSWLSLTSYATNGKRSYAITGPATASDTALTMVSGVTVPAGAWLHFRHSIDQEFAATTPAVYHDGGVVEYSLNNGATWSDIGALYSAGKNYGGVISVSTGSPIAGRSAFVGASHGYVSTRYNLATLAGNSLKLRFRNTTDASIGSGRAWAIDEVRMYTCQSNSVANVLPVANAGNDQWVGTQKPVTLDASGSVDGDGYIAAVSWLQISGPVVSLNATGTAVATFTSPVTPAQDTLVFRVTVTDNRGATATDEVTVTAVNQQPAVNAGPDQATKPRQTITLPGSATDSDGSIAAYTWTQVSGPSVTLTGAGTATAGFVAPSVAASSTLTFRLTAQDNLGGSGADEVNVIVSNALPSANAGADATVNGGASVSLTGTGTDSDGSVTGYSWQQISGPVVSLAGANGSNASFSAPSASSASTLVFRLTVTDNDNGTATDDMMVSVNATSTPASGGGGGAFGAWLSGWMGLCLLLRIYSRNRVFHKA